jgi:hypothetical protein
MFSLKSLLLAVLVAAVCVAALIKGSALWASVVFTMALILLMCGLAAIYLEPEKRSFCVPACIAGIVYGLAAFCQPLGFQTGLTTDYLFFELWYTEEMKEHFFAQGVPVESNDYVYDMLSNDLLVEPLLFQGAKTTNSFRLLQRIGHSTIAIGVAVVAGLVGSYVARWRDLKARANGV